LILITAKRACFGGDKIALVGVENWGHNLKKQVIDKASQMLEL
jgi:hypothetical protein